MYVYRILDLKVSNHLQEHSWTQFKSACNSSWSDGNVISKHLDSAVSKAVVDVIHVK